MIQLGTDKFKCGTAHLSLSLFVLFSCFSIYVAFVELIHLNDLLKDVTFICLFGNLVQTN